MSYKYKTVTVGGDMRSVIDPDATRRAQIWRMNSSPFQNMTGAQMQNMTEAQRVALVAAHRRRMEEF